MPTVDQSKFYFNFTGGLNTDSSLLSLPENSATDIDNYDLIRTGEIKRRLGVEFEAAYQLSDQSIDPTTAAQSAMSMHEWKAVNGRGDLNFLVVQVGSNLFFHDLGVDPISSSLLGTIDITPFTQGNGIPGDSIIDTSYGEGVMIVCNQNMDPVIISFDEDSSSFSTEVVTIEIRDFDGVEDGLEIGKRPLTISVEHAYNLRNQGWPTEASVAKGRSGSDGFDVIDPVAGTFFHVSLYPSNADLIWATKITAVPPGKEEVLGAYSPFHLVDHQYGNTPAARGHFIFDAFNIDRSNVSEFSGATIPQETVTVRPTTTAFYAGRVWYAGVPDKKVTGDVYFSQSLTEIDNAGKCYQDADPTAEDINSLVATDGGVIHIADMGHVYRMLQVGQDLMLFAANGVWAVSGTIGGNFVADDFSVRKVTDIGTTSADSIIEAVGAVFYWSRGGIYLISSGQIDDTLTVSRITQDKIQGLFDTISEPARAYVRGWFDEFENRVYWFYNDTESYDGVSFRFSYNRVLALDLTLQAFYPYTIEDLPSGGTPIVAGMTQKEAGSEEIITYDVVQGLGSGRDDIVEGGDDVVEDIAFPVFTNTNLKLLTLVLDLDGFYEYTFSEFNNREFKDWHIWDSIVNNPDNTGADYSAFVQIAWQTSGDTIRNRVIEHITSYFNRTETGFELDGEGNVIFTDPSGCTVQTRWDWTDSDNAGRWTTPTQAYRYKRFFLPEDETDPLDYSFQVIQTKQRMRGKGNSFSLRYESDNGKDTQLLGFAVNIRVNTKP